MEPGSRKKGFAMLEVMIIIMVFMVLAASLFASAGAIHTRAVKRTNNNEAYYAALAAVKLMAGEVMNDEFGAAGATLTSGLSKEYGKTELSFSGEEGTGGSVSRNVPVTVSSESLYGGRYLRLAAEAVVNGQTENVSMILQKRNALVPDYPYGCGLMGALEIKDGSTVTAGSDVDVYLQGYNNAQNESQTGLTAVGGNLIVDGSTGEDGWTLQLSKVAIGGMLISNNDVSLENCTVGSGKEERRGGVYTTGNLTLTNCDINGNTYSNKFTANGKEKVQGAVNYMEWVRSNYTVWNSEGEPINTSDPEYRRNGEVNASGGIWKLTSGSKLEDCVPKAKDVFVPQTDGVTKESGMNIIYLDSASGGMSLEELVHPFAYDEDHPIETVIVMEEGSGLIIGEGNWSVYIFGKGIVNIQAGKSGNPVKIYGGIQAKKINIAGSTNVEIYHGEPADSSMKTPSSAVGFKSWAPLDYDMNPFLEGTKE